MHQEILRELGLLDPYMVRPILHTLQSLGKIDANIDVDNLPDQEKIKTLLKVAIFMEGKGCSACNGTGYKGRVGAYQVMPLSTRMKEMILEGASTIEMEAQSIKENVLTLRHDALFRLVSGLTTAHEVLHETMPPGSQSVH